MIAFLKGTIAEAFPSRVLLDVHGVGYEVQIPLSTFEKLPIGHVEVTLQTVLVVREDAHILYGFFSRSEKDLFNLLVNHVSGVGPKLALAVLNGCSPAQFRGAVVAQDVGQGGFSQAGRAAEEDVVEGLPAHAGRLDHDIQPLLDLGLAGEFIQRSGTERLLENFITGRGIGGWQGDVFHSRFRASRTRASRDSCGPAFSIAARASACL